MLRVPITPDHTDARGYIADLLCEPLDSATLVFTEAGAVRGNHHHRRTHQWAYVVSGALRVITREAGTRSVQDDLVTAGDLMYSPPMEEHAWQAIDDTTVIVLTRGPRSGPGYESDTYRLAEHERLI